MNKNGEKTKLLAVIAVFAMVACALVAFAPSAEAADITLPTEGVQTINDADDLSAISADDEYTSYVVSSEIILSGATVTLPQGESLYVAENIKLSIDDGTDFVINGDL